MPKPDKHLELIGDAGSRQDEKPAPAGRPAPEPPLSDETSLDDLFKAILGDDLASPDEQRSVQPASSQVWGPQTAQARPQLRAVAAPVSTESTRDSRPTDTSPLDQFDPEGADTAANRQETPGAAPIVTWGAARRQPAPPNSGAVGHNDVQEAAPLIGDHLAHEMAPWPPASDTIQKGNELVRKVRLEARRDLPILAFDVQPAREPRPEGDPAAAGMVEGAPSALEASSVPTTDPDLIPRDPEASQPRTVVPFSQKSVTLRRLLGAFLRAFVIVGALVLAATGWWMWR